MPQEEDVLQTLRDLQARTMRAREEPRASRRRALGLRTRVLCVLEPAGSRGQRLGRRGEPVHVADPAGDLRTRRLRRTKKD